MNNKIPQPNATDATIDAPRRFWPTPQEDRHILGEVKTIKVGEYKVRALMLYEASVGRGVDPDEATILRGRVIGMDGIRCTICGKMHDWIVGQDALDELINRINPVDDQQVEHA